LLWLSLGVAVAIFFILASAFGSSRNAFLIMLNLPVALIGGVVAVLMTALAAGLALFPIALSAGEPGSEIQAPMAMVIMFGLLSSTALNMLVVPVLYERFGRPVSGVPSAVASPRISNDGLGRLSRHTDVASGS
jgi:Cu/Ag efflux pump CusA